MAESSGAQRPGGSVPQFPLPHRRSRFDDVLARGRDGVQRMLQPGKDGQSNFLDLQKSMTRLEAALGIRFHVIAEDPHGNIAPLYSQTLIHAASAAYYNSFLVCALLTNLFKHCNEAVLIAQETDEKMAAMYPAGMAGQMTRIQSRPAPIQPRPLPIQPRPSPIQPRPYIPVL